jgi:hypothetical protein
MYRKLLVVTVALVLALSVTPALAQTADATISIDVTTAAAGLGASWGRGVVTYGPKTYAFKVRGLNVLTAGIQKLQANGQVFNLKAIDDLQGKYQKADKAGITFIKKEDIGLVVKNEKGVVLNLKAVKKGLELDLVSEGLTVLKLK